ncbi:MAG: FAD-dependent oxidoreductase [Bacillota bacterium]|nr:FAD-dependent oxidoreductase [Bacillota bacterium]
MENFDLIVVGGGLTGTAASIAAARQGLKVLLVEQYNCLGGAASNSLVNPFMPYWTRDKETKQKILLSKGIFTEILNELDLMGALSSNRQVFHEEYLKIILNRMVLKAGCKILFHSYLSGADIENEHIKSVTFTNKSGLMTLFADYFIDATGDADLSVLCGCPYHIGRQQDNLCQPMTLCFRVSGVELDKYEAARSFISEKYKELQSRGDIKNPREDVLIFPSMIDGVLHFNSTRIVKRNPVDAFDLTAAEIEAREQVLELYEFMRDNIDGFKNSKLLSTAMQIGVRESRMIIGRHVLTGKEIIDCTKFEDSIATGNYDIDIHNPEGSGTSHYYFPSGEYYTIPYRSLQPLGADNLLTAGRCISADHDAQASIRIMPICTCLGEAAGVAAYVAKKMNTNFEKADINYIRKILLENGAML